MAHGNARSCHRPCAAARGAQRVALGQAGQQAGGNVGGVGQRVGNGVVAQLLRHQRPSPHRPCPGRRAPRAPDRRGQPLLGQLGGAAQDCGPRRSPTFAQHLGRGLDHQKAAHRVAQGHLVGGEGEFHGGDSCAQLLGIPSTRSAMMLRWISLLPGVDRASLGEREALQPVVRLRIVHQLAACAQDAQRASRARANPVQTRKFCWCWLRHQCCRLAPDVPRCGTRTGCRPRHPSRRAARLRGCWGRGRPGPGWRGTAAPVFAPCAGSVPGERSSRPRSKPAVAMATCQPWPSSPRRLSTGTRTLSKKISAKACLPLRARIGRMVMPGASSGTSR